MHIFFICKSFKRTFKILIELLFPESSTSIMNIDYSAPLNDGEFYRINNGNILEEKLKFLVCIFSWFC